MRSSLKKTKNSAFLFLALGILSCSCGNESSSSPTVTLQDSQGATLATVEVEIADSEAERATGLMFRESLGENQGMLFVFPSDTQSSFWMRNTLISLDMVFIDVNGLVVDLIENATPESDTLLTPRQSYRYVLEVNGGFAARHGVPIGGRAQIPSSGG